MVPNLNEGLGLLQLADTVLILINPSPSNAKVPENTNDSSETEKMTSHCAVSVIFLTSLLDSVLG